MIYYALKSQAEGRRELGAERPNGPGTGRPSGGAFRVLRRATPQRPVPSRVAEPHRRARILAPRHEAPQDEISLRNESWNPSRRAT